jgi:hypothetical protein
VNVIPTPVAPAPGVDCAVTANPLGLDPAALYGVARRYNPRRSALFVSRVLGKHVPAPPATVTGAGLLLAGQAAAALDDGERDDAVVLAFAETATALGHLVRDGLDAPHLLHTTRARLDRSPILTVEEEHSHATTHLVYHRDRAVLDGTGPLVLVDDELTTGRTMLNIIAAVHAGHPHRRYVVTALLDWRDEAAREQFARLAARLGTRIDVVSLLTGTVGGAILDGVPPTEPPPPPPPAPAGLLSCEMVELPVPPTARLGWGHREQERLDKALPDVADRLAGGLAAAGGPVRCIGTEELMYVPLRIADSLAALVDRPVHYHSSTRSPIVVADVDGYPVRHGLRFAHHHEPDRLSRVYNVGPGACDDLLVFVEAPVDRPLLAPMVGALAGTGARVTVVVLTERSP